MCIFASSHLHALDWRDFGDGVGSAVLAWVYTGHLQHQQDQKQLQMGHQQQKPQLELDTNFLVQLLVAASKLYLAHLMQQ